MPSDPATHLSHGLQDAFLSDGTYTPVDEFALADRLSAGRTSDLSEARKLISQARKSLDLGNAAGALRNLEDALRLHEGAGSTIARRPELADAHYLAGEALLRLGRGYDAERHFVDTLYLYPGYPDLRARGLSGTARNVFNRAAATVASADPRMPTTADLEGLSRALGVAAIAAPPDPLPIHGDPELLRRALLNLLLNAAQANGGGEIRVTVKPVGTDWCEISVADDGPGIPAELRKKVLQPFFTTRTSGTGLGLPLVQKTAISHGGRVDLDHPGEGGTVVRLRLPRFTA